MKRFIAIILALALFVSFSMLITVNAANTNLLTAGTFEDGLGDWTAFGGGTISIDDTTAHSGSNSVYITDRTGQWNSPGYNLYDICKAAGPGLYTISAWIYTDDADIAGTCILIRGDAANYPSFMELHNTNAYAQGDVISVFQSTWMQLSYEFIVTADDIAGDTGTFTFCFDRILADYSFYVDDVVLTVGAVPTPKPGLPAYQFTMASNYVITEDTDTYIILENAKSSIINGDSASLNVKNVGNNTFTVYLSIRNNDATWTHAIDSADLTLAPNEVGTITIASIPEGGVHPVLQLKAMNANDSFIIGNFSEWDLEFTTSAGVLTPEQIDGTGIFDAPAPTSTQTPSPSEGTSDPLTLGYAIAAISGLGALIASKKRSSLK